MTHFLYCDVARIRQQRHGPMADDPAPERAEAAAREARALAHAAFADDDASARARAERVLYAIHAYNAFSSPIDPTLNVLWVNLVRAKLRALTSDYAGRPSLPFEEMSALLREAVEEADRRDHGLLETLDDRGLIAYAKNWYTSTHGFEEQLISSLKRSPYRLRRVLFDNLGDELGPEGRPHAEMRSATLRNFGVDYDPDWGGVLDRGAAFDDPVVLTEAFSVSNARTGFSLLRDPAYSLGSFYTIEACFPAACRRVSRLLRDRGATDDELYYWALHGEADEAHSAEFLEGIKHAGLTDDVHARILNGAVSHLLARSELFAAMARRLSSSTRVMAE